MPAFLHALARLFAVLGGLLACAVALLTVASVAGRALASSPISGDVEMTQFGVALCVSLFLPWCQAAGGNINADFFTQRAGARARARLDGCGALLLAGMTGLLAWRTAAGALSGMDTGETSMILGWPTWIGYAALVPGFALTGLIALAQAAARFRDAGRAAGTRTADAGQEGAR